MRCWKTGCEWPLVIEEHPWGWALRLAESEEPEADVPSSWRDATGAFGAPSEEYRLEGQSGRWGVRLFPRQRVLAATEVPGGRIDVPEGWWSTFQGGLDRPFGAGAEGTSILDLERCERRGWREDDLAGLKLVSDWHAMDPLHGDTEMLHRVAWKGKNGSRLSEGAVLDCRGWIRTGDSEENLADTFLYLHQTHGVRWLGLEPFPSVEVERALERAHCDAQGGLFGVWIGEGPKQHRASWMRLGPWVPRLPR